MRGSMLAQQKRRRGSWLRQLMAPVVAMILASCSYIPGLSDDEPEIPKGTVGFVHGFFGGVAADEPQAVLVGRDVLAAGGSAADAAVAMYFMLSVTLPSSAGLGGGGMCLVRDYEKDTVETLDFLGQKSSGRQGVAVNVPGNPRGMFALHAKYGELRWAEMVRPAEQAARFGIQVTRALSNEFTKGRDVISSSAATRALFSDAKGQLVGEGNALEQRDLAAMLSRLRARGAGDFYTGPFAREIAAAAAAAGTSLTYQDLQKFVPKWRDALEVPFTKSTAFYFPLPRTQAGTMAAKEMAILAADEKYVDAKEDERVHLIAEAIQRAIVDGGRGFGSKTVAKGVIRNRLSEDYVEKLMATYHDDRVVQLSTDISMGLTQTYQDGGTSFVTLDRAGNAVVCGLTMNGSFGTGRSLRGMGIITAAPPASLSRRDISLGLLMLINRPRKVLFMAGASSGGPAAQAALAQVAVRTAGETPDSLEQAIAGKRIFREPKSAITYFEQGLPTPLLNALRRRGHNLQSKPSMGKVNMVFCDTGIPHKKLDVSCKIGTDPRGFGHATTPG